MNCDNTELKRSPEINFSVSERHRWTVVGQYCSEYFNLVDNLALKQMRKEMEKSENTLQKP